MSQQKQHLQQEEEVRKLNICDNVDNFDLILDPTTPSPSYTIACEYEDNAENATELCDLWCQIEAFKGGFCLKSNECPYVLMDPVLCSLWEEIQLGIFYTDYD